MGKGRRVGGSGWAGAHGSLIGVGKGKQVWGTARKGPKIKAAQPGFQGHSTLAEARAAGLSLKQWREQCNRHVVRLEREVKDAKKQLAALTVQLTFAENARKTAFGPVNGDSGKAPSQPPPVPLLAGQR